MKIAQVTTVFPPFKGGMGQVPYHYARELHIMGEDVEVITPDYGRGTIEEEFAIDYVKPVLKWGLGAFCPQLFSRLDKYDVVILHHPALGMGIVTALWKFLKGSKTKLVLFYHMDNIGSGIFRLLFPLYNFFLQPFILNTADTILVSSIDYIQNSSIKKYYKKYPQRFRELPFGVTKQFQPKDKVHHKGMINSEGRESAMGQVDKTLLNKFNIDANKKMILYVGGLGPEHYFKGIDVLLKACAQLESENWQLVCVGRGNMIEKHEKTAKDLKIENSVTFTGFQPDESLPDWYNSATVTVLPSINSSEAFGILLVEAMACGSPVIASNLPGVRTVVQNNINGLTAKPADADDLAMKINKIITDDTLQTKFSQNALQIAQDKYQWSKIVRQLVNILQK